MFALMNSLNIPLVMEDTKALLAYADGQAAANTDIVGTVGYCMSGRYAVNAATHFPDRVKAAASIYGTHLATDQPDSPHLAARKTKAELYFGCAETDIYAPQEIIEKVNAGMKRRQGRGRDLSRHPSRLRLSEAAGLRPRRRRAALGAAAGALPPQPLVISRGLMPFLPIAFPVFDPIAIAIGPIAIRWYALAYIGGIVLGWIYARALIKNERLWGGPAPITLLQLDDFILWVTVGIILGGRTGYVLFYNLPFFIAASRRDLRTVEGRHVVPWRLPRLRRRGDLVLPQERPSDPVARRHHHRGRADRAVSRADRQFHQQRIVGPAGRSQPALGDDLSQWRAAAAPSEPALRGRAGGHPAVHDARGDDPPRRAEAARADPRQLHRALRFCAHHRRVFPRARPAARIFVGRADHGYAAVGADDHCRRDHYCGGMAPQGDRSRSPNSVQGRP